jgi:hypothetical protein
MTAGNWSVIADELDRLQPAFEKELAEFCSIPSELGRDACAIGHALPTAAPPGGARVPPIGAACHAHRACRGDGD